MSKLQRIAVTGANGFIGKHVVAELKKQGIEVIPLCREDFNIHAKNPPSYKNIGSPDALLHLAWGALDKLNSPSHIEDELPAHYRFLESLIATGLPSLMVMGTCFEYGMQSGELSENLEVNPHTTYGQAKNYLRQKLQDLQQDKEFNLTWGRLFYTHGEGQAKKSLIPLLAKDVKDKKAVFNMSAGEQLRDYLPVKKVAEYTAALAMRGENDGVVNICSGTPISVKSLIEDRIEQNNWKIELNLGYYPYSDYEPMEFWGSNKKLKKLLKL